ncbi:MAG: FAD-dependent oxidoreductase [Planctomycetota bacterium]
MSRFVAELDRAIPICADVDVLVCGGGPAGFCAAVAAARTLRDAGKDGARVLLIEQTNCLGGIATAGGHNHLCLYSAWGEPETRVVGGVPFEMANRVVRAGRGAWEHDPARTSGGSVDFELEGLKLVLEQMAAEAGVELLYHTQFADAFVEGGRVAGAYIQNKSGRQVIRAARVVDATGDADVAASTDAPFEMGRASDGACQPATLMFTIGGVDWPRVCEARRDDHKLTDTWRRAQDAGDMDPFQSRIMGFWWTPTRPDQVGVNFTHVVGTDCTNARSVTDATIEGRHQADHMIPVFRKYVPGMEACYLISTAALLGTRESRRIIGEHVLTEQEVMGRATFDDGICYGSFFIDVHNCTGPGMDAETWWPQAGFRYQIPYRCLVPLQVDNLLVAGRCISATHVALGSTRVMPQCGALGEAAGAAAALSIRDDGTPRELDAQKLRRRLRYVGAIVDEDGIEHTA